MRNDSFFRSIFLLKATALIMACGVSSAWAQIEVNDEEMNREGAKYEQQQVDTGEGAARQYFNRRAQSSDNSNSSPSTSRAPAASTDRYLTLHIGTFLNEDVYRWGKKQDDDVGQLNAGVTYRVGEWVNSMDLLFRADFTNYTLNEGNASKLSFVPMITFPDAKSGFPLYFGAGAGLGVFLKQIDDESALSFDYQVVAGARFFDVIEGFGFMIESGMKNHLLLLSDGQYNGVFLTIGGVFNF